MFDFLIQKCDIHPPEKIILNFLFEKSRISKTQKRQTICKFCALRAAMTWAVPSWFRSTPATKAQKYLKYDIQTIVFAPFPRIEADNYKTGST